MLLTDSCQIEEEIWLVDAEGCLELETAAQLDAVLEAVPGGTRWTVLLDLERVPFMDSSAAAVILRAKRRLEARGARLAILHPHPMPRSFLHRTHLDCALRVADTVLEAIERADRAQAWSESLVAEARALRAEAAVSRRRAARPCLGSPTA